MTTNFLTHSKHHFGWGQGQKCNSSKLATRSDLAEYVFNNYRQRYRVVSKIWIIFVRFWPPMLKNCSREVPNHLRWQKYFCCILEYDRSVPNSICSLIRYELMTLAEKLNWGEPYGSPQSYCTVHRIFNYLLPGSVAYQENPVL